ncbi:unnamed protein product [Adineta ricciae]|uniref:Pentapeptide repeat-containing protein n=1 Tax=Adineta ricciae TaxID=249248 RepID=A0A815IP09_ADIRI|nr:unnamed protein product [Adineta ricciae]CAF1626468.1 unnamed protein product [Adineta ricciae]
MSSPDQSAITNMNSNSDRNCRLTLKDGLQFISSLILPLMLGVFTVIITLEQQRISQEQRAQDLAELRLQREQDMNISMLQRALDKQTAKEQREEAELRRIQDLNISESKRAHDNELAEKQRDLLERQRLHELDIETQRHQDTLLVAYMNEVGILLEKSNGCLSLNPLIATLVRVKTLTLARQIDSTRNTQVIQFLYEAGQLTNGQQPLDLHDAEFNGIDLSSSTVHSKLHKLYLFGARLNNASFRNRDLTNANFSEAYLQDASFVRTYLDHVDFSRATLITTDFYKSEFINSVFNYATMIGLRVLDAGFSTCQFIGANIRKMNIDPRTSFSSCNFTDTVDLYHMNFTDVDFQSSYFKNVYIRENIFVGAIFQSAKFINTKLSQNDLSRISASNIRFNNVELSSIIFTNSILTESVWVDSRIINSNFEHANLINANFRKTIVKNVTFSQATITDGSFIDVSLSNSNFYQCHCDHMRFDGSLMDIVSFHKAVLAQSSFSDSWKLSNVNFTGIDGRDADFSSINLITNTFEGAQLIGANFAWSVCDSVNFLDADLTDADMSHTFLSGSNLTREQLDKAMSISDTYFQTKKLRNPNLLVSSLTSCDSNILSAEETVWIVNPRDTQVQIVRPDKTRCYFSTGPNMTHPITMSQQVSISKYERLIGKKKADVYVAINIWSTAITAYLTASGPKRAPANHTFEVIKQSRQQLLKPVFVPLSGTTQLLLSIVFESNTSMCNSIDLSVQHRPIQN